MIKSKHNISEKSIYNHKTAIICSLLLYLLFGIIGFIFFFSAVIRNQHINFNLVNTNIPEAACAFSCNILVCYIMFMYAFEIAKRKWKSQKQKIIITIGGLVVISIIINHIITILIVVPIFHYSYDRMVVINNVRNTVMPLIIFFTTVFLATVLKNHQIAIQNKELMLESIKNRYEALKNQLEPHFLFNSLNTLDGLISLEDQDAHNYLQNLSSTFRYSIQNKEITKLSDELKFTKSYAYLMKIRYGDNLQINYEIDDKYLSYYIMPISIQLLLENAIKHNIINDKYPLTINIKIENEKNDAFIKVENNIKLKANDYSMNNSKINNSNIYNNSNSEKNETLAYAGIGLTNLTERYKLMFHREIIIKQEEKFSVEIPLIDSNGITVAL